MIKIAGAVILYNPDGNLMERINSYIGHVEKLYVIDNSEPPCRLQFKNEKIVYVVNGANQGVAASLNKAAEFAVKDQMEWLLTMDQDSWFDSINISNYINCFDRFPGKAMIACFGVEFLEKKAEGNICNSKKVIHMITSGSLLSLNAFKNVGPFNEELFIDQVDFEFCYRAALQGYSNIQFTSIFLNHSLGTSSLHRSLKNFSTSKRSLHAPVRLYYMTRNYLYVSKRYKTQFPAEILHTKKDLLNRIKNNLLYGNNKMSVMGHVISGALDYYRGRMGKKR